MTVADRLKAARTRAGFTDASDAARHFGWKPSTYLGHENGSRGIKLDVATTYARAFRVSPQFILFGKEGPADIAPVAVAPDLVPVYNVQASAGHGALVSDEMIVDRLCFPPGYLRSITSANARDLAIIGVKGESMLPTLADDDVVMVDMSKRDLSFDGLFVLRDGGESLLVKRIGRAARRGFVTLISDNTRYPPIERPVEDVEVVGKVVWKGVRE